MEHESVWVPVPGRRKFSRTCIFTCHRMHPTLSSPPQTAHLCPPILLDAESAFDVVLKEFLIKNLLFSGTSGETLLYLNNRLSNRQTFLDWNGQLMGPIIDERFLEQGGVSSSDFYKNLQPRTTTDCSKLSSWSFSWAIDHLWNWTSRWHGTGV